MSVAARSTATVIGVWLATPPSTYARRPIVTGGNTPGMAQLASSAGTAGPHGRIVAPPPLTTLAPMCSGAEACSVRSHREVFLRMEARVLFAMEWVLRAGRA